MTKLLMGLIPLAITFSSSSGLARAYVGCNRGAVVVVDTDRPGVFAVRVLDRGVAEFFKKRIAQTRTGKSVYVKEEADGTLTISELRTQDGRHFTSGQFGPTFSLDARNGGKLILTYFHMNNSHQYDAYEIGNWYFESCARR